MGGKLVINLLPFTSGRIDSEETKRKTRRGKPRVSGHLGKLRETRLSHAYLPQCCLTIGEQETKAPVGGQPAVAWAPALIRCPAGPVLTPLRLVPYNACQVGALHPFLTEETLIPSFTHSVFVESALRQSWIERELHSVAFLAHVESFPRSLASIIHEPRWTVPTSKPGESLLLPGCWGPVRGGHDNAYCVRAPLLPN